MESVVWLLAVALAITVVIPIGLYVAFRRSIGPAFVQEETEGRGILPEEWAFVYQRHCLPTRCSRLRGDPPACPRTLECQICAAYVMERHWQQLTAVRPRRRLSSAAWVWIGALLVGAAGGALYAARLAGAAYALAAGSIALILGSALLRAGRALRRRVAAHRRHEHTHLSPPFAAG